MDVPQYAHIIERSENHPSQLIEILHDIQAECQYLPEDALRAVAAKLAVPLIEVFRVASFFKAFSLVPRGKHLITVCTGTACHVRGAPRLLDQVRGQLNVSPGQTTLDGAFTLEAVNCLGACALGPVVVLDGTYHDHVTPAKLRKLIEAARTKDKEHAADAQRIDT
jgi:NADH:ubiquinone oxidoreductase subunit E